MTDVAAAVQAALRDVTLPSNSIAVGERKNNRRDIPLPSVEPGANSWQSGKTMQLKFEEVPVRNLRK